MLYVTQGTNHIFSSKDASVYELHQFPGEVQRVKVLHRQK